MLKAIRHATDMVEVREDEEVSHYNLHCGFHCDRLQDKVGKQVFDLLWFNKNKWIDVKTLEISEEK